MAPQIGLQGRVRPRNPSFATRWISFIEPWRSPVAIAAIGDMVALWSPKISHAQSFHTRHCAMANSGSGVAHMARPLFGNMISASIPSRA